MTRILVILAFSCSLLLGVGCSKQEKTDADSEEWSDIRPITNEASPMTATNAPLEGNASGFELGEGETEFEAFELRLAELKTAERRPGQTLLTGEKLVFDYKEHFVRMDGDVSVQDDQGTLKTESLIGRFTTSNQVEQVEAKGGVSIVSGERSGRADAAVYNYGSGLVQLDGQSVVSEGGNTLSAERIQFWIKGSRKMVCEPNALLVVSGDSSLGLGELPGGGETEVRANRIVYDESRSRADLTGRVRLRDERVAMDCGEVHLFLKDNKIDWIEAVSEVIIQTEDRKALADRATYHEDDGKFTLEGSPKVMQGRNVMTGDRIIFWHETRRMVCEPNARVLLYLDEMTKAKFLKDLND